MVNKAILIGNLGKDAEALTVGEGNHALIKFSICTKEKWKGKDGGDKEDIQWHNIVAWGKGYHNVAPYLLKGVQVYIEGAIENKKVEKDGVTKYYSQINAKTIQLLGTPGPKKEAPKANDDDLPF